MQTLQPSWAWTPEGVLEDPIVTIDDGIILRCSEAPRHPLPGVERLPGRLLLPGLVNAHSHAFQRAFRGHVQWRAAGHDDFWSWRDAMYDVAARLTPESIQAISRLAFLEMAESGITEVGEFHYVHHQADGVPYDDPDELARRVIAAARSVGLRITLMRVAYHRGGPGAPLGEAQRRFRTHSVDEALTAIDRLRSGAADGVRVGLAPHSVRAVPPEWWGEFSAFRGPVHAHVAEQPREVEGCLAETGRSPLGLIAEAGLLDERFTAVHFTWPSEGDLGALVSGGARVCVCPTTELDLGDGFLPLEVRERASLCLGSDSHAMIDLWHEARTLELHGRGLAGRRNVLAPVGERHGLAERLLRAATLEGARALGSTAGVLAAGHPADLVAVDLRRPSAAGVPPLEAAIFGAGPDHVSEVWVGGRQIIREGRHPDRERIVREALAAMG